MQTLADYTGYGLAVLSAFLVGCTAVPVIRRATCSDDPLARRGNLAGAVALGIGLCSAQVIALVAISAAMTTAAFDPWTLVLTGVTTTLAASAALRCLSCRQQSAWLTDCAALAFAVAIVAAATGARAALSEWPPRLLDGRALGAAALFAVVAIRAVLALCVQSRTPRRTAVSVFLFTVAVVAAHHAAQGGALGGHALSVLSPGAIAVSEAVTIIALLGMTMIAYLLPARLRTITASTRVRVDNQRLRRANAELLHQATHDALTGLPNRILFMDRLGREIAYADRDPHRFGVIVLDLDRFKLINDTLGHGAGDQLLIAVAQRLSSAMRAADTVARTGGDEFLMLIRNVNRHQDIEVVARKIVAVLSDPYRLDGREVHCSSSIGISCFPEHGRDVQSLLARGDEAMYFAKRHGTNAFEFYVAGMSGFSQERLDLENDLRHALAAQQFELYYQPKVDVRTGSTNSVEALLRWHHPRRGLVSPAEFIPLAEETGLILNIGEWVLREACRQARAWQVAGMPFVRVAVNLSPVQFRQIDFLSIVHAALVSNALDPRYLEIEVTESAVMTHPETSARILEELSRLGVIVDIDDFGTGYSSMSYLRRFPIDKLKIDRSFIHDLATDQDDAAIVRAIISLAHGLRLKVIAEGVETSNQLARLRDLGCDQYQGFYNSPPLPARELEAMICQAAQAPVDAEPAEFMRTYSRLGAYRGTPARE